MVRAFRSAALGTLVLMLVTASAPAAAAPSATPPALSGVVTLSGSAPGYVPVTVAKRLTLPNPFVTVDRDAVQVRGGGTLSGFALVRDDLQMAIIAGQSPKTQKYHDLAGPFVFNIGPDAANDTGGFVVEPGRYKLYLVTGGKPTTVRLTFRGGSGTRTLRPTVRTKEVVQAGAASPGTGPGVHTAGFDTLAGPSVHFSVAAFRTSVHAESLQMKCFFSEKPSGPNPYLPGCPSTDGGTGLRTVQPVSDENPNESTYYFTYYSLLPTAGHYASGVNYNSLSLLAESHYAHYFLDLGAPAKAASGPAAAPQPPATGTGPAAPAPAAPAIAAAAAELPATGTPAALAAGPALLLAAAAARRRTRSG